MNSDGSNNDTVDRASTGGRSEVAQNPTNSASTARIAFMITSSMKRDLVDGLGYQASVVKGMTPQQASLVLHHRLAPESYEEEISSLEKEFEEEQQQELQILESEPSTNRVSESLVQTSEESNDESTTLLIESSASHESEEVSSPSTPREPTLDDIEIRDGTDLWYEVVEIQEDGVERNEIRHGLYKDRDEAVLGLEARQDIHSKRQLEAKAIKSNRSEGESDGDTQISFVLRPISGEDVQ